MPAPLRQQLNARKAQQFAAMPSGIVAIPIHVGDHAGIPTEVLPPNTQLIRRLNNG